MKKTRFTEEQMVMNAGSGSVTWEGRASGRPGDSRETVDHQVFLGGLALHLQFNMQERTARVQDIEVSLQNANVILVDRVDSREDLTGLSERGGSIHRYRWCLFESSRSSGGPSSL